MKPAFSLLFALLCAVAVMAQKPVQQFYPSGQLESTRFNDGSMDHFITYYESGRVKAMGAFLNGYRQGLWKQFDESGVVVAEASFTQGHRTGVWEFRDGANTLRGRLSYADGRLVAGEQYEDGALVALRSY